MTRHPVFVYGTLRPGQGNDRRWVGRAVSRHDGAASVIGYRLVHNRAFPYAVPAPGEVTVGCLIVPDDEHYDAVLASLDHLEGVPHHYGRRLIWVDIAPDAGCLAWIYTPARLDHLPTATVPGNDWTLVRS